jgi:quercetin dioxygenase-like cupin family protein
MEATRWQDHPVEELSPKIGRRMFHTDATTVAWITLAQGALVPEHDHPNEQIATVLEGRVRFVVDGEELVAAAGETVPLAANVPHSAEALEDSVVLDVFAPRREDWISGDDAYLRG